MAAVFRYSFAQAKTRALKAQLLSREDWSVLLKMKSLRDALKYLSGTAYGAALFSSHLGTDPDMRAISLALHDSLFSDGAKLLKAVPQNSAPVLKGLLLRYEAENLKTILRGIRRGTPPEDVRSLLFRLGSLSRLPVEDLLQVRQIEPTLDLLEASPFHTALRHAFPQYQAGGRLFPLEIAIDMTAVEQAARGLEALRGLDRKGAQTLLGTWIDGLGLTWLVRFRHITNLSPEEAIHYTPSGGRFITLADLGRLARAGDPASFLTALPPPYREILAPAENWAHIPILLSGWFAEELLKAFRGDPFRITLPLAHLFMKEREVKSLESLLSTLALKHAPERLVEWGKPSSAEGESRVQV